MTSRVTCLSRVLLWVAYDWSLCTPIEAYLLLLLKKKVMISSPWGWLFFTCHLIPVASSPLGEICWFVYSWNGIVNDNWSGKVAVKGGYCEYGRIILLSRIGNGKTLKRPGDLLYPRLPEAVAFKTAEKTDGSLLAVIYDNYSSQIYWVYVKSWKGLLNIDSSNSCPLNVLTRPWQINHLSKLSNRNTIQTQRFINHQTIVVPLCFYTIEIIAHSVILGKKLPPYS